MLLKYAWNLLLVTSYLLDRNSCCSSKCDEDPCPELASYVFLWAITLWICGRNLKPPCLPINCNLEPLYQFIAIPVISSIIHRLLWTDLIGFLRVIEFYLYEMLPFEDHDDYRSMFDPNLTISLSDVLALGGLIWVLKSYSIIDCIVSLVNKLSGCTKEDPIPCIRDTSSNNIMEQGSDEYDL